MWDVDGAGLSFKEARERATYEDRRLGKYDFSATGQLRGLNGNHDASVQRISEVVDPANAQNFGQIETLAKSYIQTGPNWAGTITTQHGFIEGEHNPGDLFDESMIVSNRDVRPGMNLWVPNWQGGTLFHISGVDVSDNGFVVRLMVDTRARDSLTLSEILDRNEANRISPTKQFRLERSSSFNKTQVLGWTGRLGGKVDADVFLTGGQWTIIPVLAADQGLALQIRTRVRAYTSDIETTFEGSSPHASTSGLRHVVMAFGRDVRTNNDTNASAFLEARRPNPFVAGDLDDVKDAIDDFNDRKILGSWGGEDVSGEITYCGYGEFGSDGTLTGNFVDRSGFPIDAPDCFVYIAIWVATDAVALAGRYIWPQLHEGT
jgi:hypothetical protein